MQEARAALAAGDPNRALDLYRAAVTRGGPAAENAEYEIGRVMRDRLRQPTEAIATWKRYRSSHPNGLLRVETDVSIIETLVASGDSSAALAEANDFLRHHADSERRAEIARISGDLYRERGDCGHAVGSYQTALAASRAREITEYASYQRAACLVGMGDASGNAAVEEYLHAWPRGRFSRDANRLLQGMTSAPSHHDHTRGGGRRAPGRGGVSVRVYCRAVSLDRPRRRRNEGRVGLRASVVPVLDGGAVVRETHRTTYAPLCVGGASNPPP